MNSTTGSGWLPGLDFCVLAMLIVLGSTSARTQPKPAEESVNIPALEVTASPFAQYRRLELRAADKPVTHRPSPLAGVSLSTRTLLLWDPDLKLRVQLLNTFDHARGTTPTLETTGDTADRTSTRYTSGSGRLALSRFLGDRLRASISLGLRADSWVLSPNPVYTGHRYVAAETGVGLSYRFPSTPAQLRFEFAALPVIDVNLSGGAHGGGTAFGGRATAVGTWTPFAPNNPAGNRAQLLLHTRLRYTRYRARFPSSPFDPGGATTIDQSGSISLGLGYRM